MSQDSDRRVQIAVCEKHGLRYNAAEGQGCVRCRREAGIAAPPTGAVSLPAAGAGTAAGGPRPDAPRAAAPAADRPASGLVQALIAVALVAGTGTLFWSLHGQLMAGLPAMLGAGAEDAAYEAEGGMPVDDGSPYGGNEPAAYPPDGVGGPADQQRQLDEILRDMQADEAEDARRAAEAAEAGDGYGDDGGDGDAYDDEAP